MASRNRALLPQYRSSLDNYSTQRFAIHRHFGNILELRLDCNHRQSMSQRIQLPAYTLLATVRL